jgi:hypothetical protein
MDHPSNAQQYVHDGQWPDWGLYTYLQDARSGKLPRLSKAWNKRYRIAVCDVKYAYCDTTLQGDYLKKKRNLKKIFLKIKYDPLIHFIHIKMQ